MNVYVPHNSPYIKYFNSELSVVTFYVLCVLSLLFVSNMQFIKTSNYLVNFEIAFRIY
jgi:hypothetical protein